MVNELSATSHVFKFGKRCWVCNIESNRIFCNIICSRIYYKYFTSIIMNHTFVFNESSPGACKTCKRRMTDHTAAARCESCGMQGICSLIDNVLLCDKRCAQEKAIQL